MGRASSRGTGNAACPWRGRQTPAALSHVMKNPNSTGQRRIALAAFDYSLGSFGATSPAPLASIRLLDDKTVAPCGAHTNPQSNVNATNFFSHTEHCVATQQIRTFLWFDNQAEEAASFYASLFKDSRTTGVIRYGEAGPGPAGSAMIVEFQRRPALPLRRYRRHALRAVRHLARTDAQRRDRSAASHHRRLADPGANGVRDRRAS